MKIILSRKGFDSGVGKVASPIFPDGTLCSLPIPESRPQSHSKRYGDIRMGERSLGDIVEELTRGRIKSSDPVHLDPDLNHASLSRLASWKPLFGQAGAAEGHLRKNGVCKGDVFIFYGWFKQVELRGETYRYVKGAPDLHVIFGWLQIEERIPIDHLSEIPCWALDHPHCKREPYHSLDSLYISSDYMKLPHAIIDEPGAGTFRRFDSALCLTAPGMQRSVWRLPKWFYPSPGRTGLSYHSAPARWRSEQDYVLLNSVGRGQEFVLDCEEYPEAIEWVCSLLSFNKTPS